MSCVHQSVRRPPSCSARWALATAFALTAGARAADIEIGFCSDDGDGFLQSQPASQLERWQLPVDNGSHLVIRWSPDARLDGKNVTSYAVDVKTSLPILNMFVGTFGGFPQDLCAAGGSKARDAVSISDSKSSCSPYPARASSTTYVTSFEVPDALRRLASWDISVTARGYGTFAAVGAPPGAPQSKAVWWCHRYRRPESAASHEPRRGVASPSSGRSGWARVLFDWLAARVAKPAARPPPPPSVPPWASPWRRAAPTACDAASPSSSSRRSWASWLLSASPEADR